MGRSLLAVAGVLALVFGAVSSFQQRLATMRFPSQRIPRRPSVSSSAALANMPPRLLLAPGARTSAMRPVSASTRLFHHGGIVSRSMIGAWRSQRPSSWTRSSTVTGAAATQTGTPFLARTASQGNLDLGIARMSSTALKEQPRPREFYYREDPSSSDRKYVSLDSFEGSSAEDYVPDEMDDVKPDVDFMVDPYDNTVVQPIQRPTPQRPAQKQIQNEEQAPRLVKSDYAALSRRSSKTTTTSSRVSRSKATYSSNKRYAGVSELVSDPVESKTTTNYFNYPRMSLKDEISHLGGELERLQKEIYQLAQSEFNINSPRQVSLALFGSSDQPTNKNALEAIAGANPLAKLIVEFRIVKSRHTKLEKRKVNQSNGVHVRDVLSKSVAVLIDPVGSDSESSGDDDQQVTPKISTIAVPADPLLLVDTSAYIFRAYFSMPPMHRSDGMPTGAVLGFCNMINRIVLQRLLDGDRPRILLAMDAPGDTFRHKLYKDYKGNRPAAPMDLIPQFDLIREAADAYGLTMVELDSFEADDVIATLSRQAIETGMDVNILSGDKDLMQLVTLDDGMTTDDENSPGQIQMIDPVKMVRVDHAAVVEKWGVPADRLGDVLALAGDSADNIPGVPGIGPKIAASLINEFGSLDELLERFEEIPQKSRRSKVEAHVDQARLSRKLVELERNVPLSLPDELRMEALDIDRLLSFYDRMGFITIKRQVADRFERSKMRGTSKMATAAKVKKKKSMFGSRPKATLPKPEDYDSVPF